MMNDKKQVLDIGFYIGIQKKLEAQLAAANERINELEAENKQLTINNRVWEARSQTWEQIFIEREDGFLICKFCERDWDACRDMGHKAGCPLKENDNE